jgi:hypothetical protein
LPLVRLLQAYLLKGGAGIISSSAILEGFLGIFVKLISNRVRGRGFYY